jgi:ankyrin repeat protein
VSNQCGHAKVAKHLIDGGADVNTTIKSGASALYTACFRVRHLPACSTTAMCSAWLTSFSLADPRVLLSLLQGHVDVIELLLENGADVNKAKSDGATPLFAAAQQ